VNDRRKSTPQKASEILEALLGRTRYARELKKYKFAPYWKQIVGEQLFKVCQIDSVRGRTLWVRVPDSGWAQEISFQKDIIIQRVNKHLGEQEQIVDLRFNVGT
jgi:hypothetical protein